MVSNNLSLERNFVPSVPRTKHGKFQRSAWVLGKKFWRALCRSDQLILVAISCFKPEKFSGPVGRFVA